MQILVESSIAAGEGRILFNKLEDDILFFLNLGTSLGNNDFFLCSVGIVASVDHAQLVSQLSIVSDHFKFGDDLRLGLLRLGFGFLLFFLSLDDFLLNFAVDCIVNHTRVLLVRATEIESDENDGQNHHKTDFKMQTFLFFEVGFLRFFCFHITNF